MDIFLSFFVWIASWFIWAITGAGWLISIPFLIFIWLPPQVAIATNKFWAVWLNISAIHKFSKAKKIIWKYIPLFSILSIIGAIIGAKILLSINEEIVNKVVWILIIILIPITFINKNLGIKRKSTSFIKECIGSFLYFLLMIFGWFFGWWAWPMRSILLMYFFWFTIIEANATHRIPWFILSLISLIIFMFSWIVNYIIGISLFLWMLVGWYIWTHTAIKKWNFWVKIFFSIIIIILGLKIIVF